LLVDRKSGRCVEHRSSAAALRRGEWSIPPPLAALASSGLVHIPASILASRWRSTSLPQLPLRMPLLQPGFRGGCSARGAGTSSHADVAFVIRVDPTERMILWHNQGRARSGSLPRGEIGRPPGGVFLGERVIRAAAVIPTYDNGRTVGDVAERA